MAQIYVKSDKEEDYTSILVANDKGDIYYSEVLEVPEITGIQRGVSYVKNNINKNEPTEIFSEKVAPTTIWQDPYIKYTKLPVMIGTELSKIHKLERQCKMKLQQHYRWNMFDRNSYEK